jgi:hypothetical protein
MTLSSFYSTVHLQRRQLSLSTSCRTLQCLTSFGQSVKNAINMFISRNFLCGRPAKTNQITLSLPFYENYIICIQNIVFLWYVCNQTPWQPYNWHTVCSRQAFCRVSPLVQMKPFFNYPIERRPAINRLQSSSILFKKSHALDICIFARETNSCFRIHDNQVQKLLQISWRESTFMTENIYRQKQESMYQKRTHSTTFPPFFALVVSSTPIAPYPSPLLLA